MEVNMNGEAIANGNMQETSDVSGNDKPQRSLSSKLLIAILLSLAAPFTVCVFGTFEIYSANLSEFSFSLFDFLQYELIFALGAAALIFAFLMLMRGIAFDIASTCVAWISLMLFVERNYLSLFTDSSFLAGDGNNAAGTDVGAIVLNTAIWLVIGAAMVAAVIVFRKKRLEVINAVLVVAMIALIGMQTVTFGITSLTTDTFTSVVDRAKSESGNQGVPMVLTYENIGELSEGKNIVFFLVDRFDADYYERMVKSDPEFFDRLDGFTHFSDYTSLYARTYPAVASILTGKDHDYFTAGSKASSLASFYSDGGGSLGILKENGYSINIYGEKGYDYTDASVMADYVDNTMAYTEYRIDNNFALAKDMLLLSMSQYLPKIATFGWSGMLSTPMFNDHANYEVDGVEMFSVDEKSTAELKSRLEKTGLAEVESEGQFTFIHLYGCHDISKSSNENIANTFELIYYYIDQMKALGIYEDATIIITGDHAAALSDSKMIGSANSSDDGTRVTAMLFKKSGDAGTPLATSTSQVSQDELWNTIFESEGMLDEKSGESFFDIPEGEDRERRYYFEMYKNSKNNDLEYNKVYEYKIVGNANESESWELVKETYIKK